MSIGTFDPAWSDPSVLPAKHLDPSQAPDDGLDPHLPVPSANAEGSRRLAKLLRLVGAGFLFTSACTFLLHRWEASSDLTRYAVLLAHTLLLVLAALFCGFRVKESRGARTFLALTLAIVPINAAVLGGLVYSRFALDANNVVPSEFVWLAPSALHALVCVGVSLALLTPVSWFAFRTLAKPRATALLLAFLAVNASLVVPVRIPVLTGCMVVVLAALLTAVDARVFGLGPAMHTSEGRLARLALVWPLLLVLLRGLYLYPDTLLHFSALQLAAGLVLAHRARGPAQRDLTVGLGVGAAMLLGSGYTLGWSHFCEQNTLSGSLVLPSLLLPNALVLALLSGHLGRLCTPARALAAALTLGAVVPNLWLYPGLWTLLGCATLGALVLCYGVHAESKLLALGGGAAVLSALVYHLVGSIRFDMLSHWLTLSTLGILLIVGASYWERYQLAIGRALGRLGSAAKSWDY